MSKWLGKPRPLKVRRSRRVKSPSSSATTTVFSIGASVLSVAKAVELMRRLAKMVKFLAFMASLLCRRSLWFKSKPDANTAKMPKCL